MAIKFPAVRKSTVSGDIWIFATPNSGISFRDHDQYLVSLDLFDISFTDRWVEVNEHYKFNLTIEHLNILDDLKLGRTTMQNRPLDIIRTIMHASKAAGNPNRSDSDILTHLVTEVGELAQEIEIANGKSYKDPGLDGVLGECVDVVMCAIDLLLRSSPMLMSVEDIEELFVKKCKKWVETTNLKTPL